MQVTRCSFDLSMVRCMFAVSGMNDWSPVYRAFLEQGLENSGAAPGSVGSGADLDVVDQPGLAQPGRPEDHQIAVRGGPETASPD